MKAKVEIEIDMDTIHEYCETISEGMYGMIHDAIKAEVDRVILETAGPAVAKLSESIMVIAIQRAEAIHHHFAQLAKENSPEGTFSDEPKREIIEDRVRPMTLEEDK